MDLRFLIHFLTALQEVKKLWEMERSVGYIIGKISLFNFTDTDIRSLCGANWLTDQVCLFFPLSASQHTYKFTRRILPTSKTYIFIGCRLCMGKYDDRVFLAR
jgi:hypothetical protein